MPRASAAAAAQTADDILRSAVRLLAERGFAELSIDEVARAAGVTRGAVYHHYGNRLGLFTAVAGALQADVARSVVSAAEAAGDGPEEQLRVGCHAFLDAITSASMARTLLVDAPSVIGWSTWRAQDAQNSVAQLRLALSEAGVPAELVDATTAQLSGAMNDAALWISEQPDQAAARESAHRVLDRLIDAVLPHPPR
ncbi:TetR/AcrR family transcriptional regulator [Nesterenkonia sp. CF4.4]|uniref:TetR/AcrR family transcriptional regulator n=1 Tax=Nesterenkonia sp. CF4.4 TaxID=3373079 RepID=UPI003EE48CC9